MLIPLIANGPLQGPSPTLIADHGAAKDHVSHAAKQDTKDTFGALFREGDIAKKPPAVAQETGIPVYGETPEDEIGLEGRADQDADFKTEPDVASGLITSDQEDAPDRTETATLMAPNQFDSDTQSDPGKQVAPNPELRIGKADQDKNLETVKNISPLSVAPSPLPVNADLQDATEANKIIANAPMGANKTMVPDQEGPATPAAPVANKNVAAPTTGPAEQTPIEGAKAQPLTASAAAILPKPQKTAQTCPNAVGPACLPRVLRSSARWINPSKPTA